MRLRSKTTKFSSLFVPQNFSKKARKKKKQKRSLVNFWCSRPSFRRLAVLGLSQFILYKSRCELSLFFNIFSYLNLICANSLGKRNLQEQVKKTFCYQKLFWPFTALFEQTVLLQFLQILGLQPRISKIFSITRTIFSHSRSEQFENKIPFLSLLNLFDKKISWNCSTLFILFSKFTGCPISG